MKGQNDTHLTYDYDGGTLAVGFVTCVPRKGEIVELALGTEPIWSFRVEQVTWIARDDPHPRDAYTPTPCTFVRVALSRCT